MSVSLPIVQLGFLIEAIVCLRFWEVDTLSVLLST